jgi:hypothetical protein
MFDTQAFLRDHFPDADAIIGLLGAYRLPTPNREAARKWVSRNSVPAEWFPLLAAALELDFGAPISLTKYIKAGNTDANIT